MPVTARNLVPPSSQEAEQTVLGAILFSNSIFVDVIEKVSAEEFYWSVHQKIFKAMTTLFQAGEPIDILTVSELLNDSEALEEVGGRPYLMELSLSVATSANAPYYADKVHNYALRRRIIELSRQLEEIAFESDTEDALEFAQAGILSVAQAADKKTDQTTETLAQEAFRNIQARLHHPNRVVGLSTGSPQLDRYSMFQPGKLVILGARPAMGKSGLALNLAEHVARNEKKPVLFYSLEMEPVDLVERALIAHAESQTALDKLSEAVQQFPSNLKIIDRPSLTITALRSSILKNKLEMGEIGLVVVDYLQLMKGSGGNRNEEVSGLSRGLKLLAREFKVPILALAQLSRKLEERQDKRPINSDLRDSGAIEQDADSIVFIYRDDYYNQQSDKPNTAEIIVGKNRKGKTGAFDLFFRPNIVKFVDPETIRRGYAAY
jgi:replicative DNA helicase